MKIFRKRIVFGIFEIGTQHAIFWNFSIDQTQAVSWCESLELIFMENQKVSALTDFAFCFGNDQDSGVAFIV